MLHFCFHSGTVLISRIHKLFDFCEVNLLYASYCKIALIEMKRNQTVVLIWLLMISFWGFRPIPAQFKRSTHEAIKDIRTEKVHSLCRSTHNYILHVGKFYIRPKADFLLKWCFEKIWVSERNFSPKNINSVSDTINFSIRFFRATIINPNERLIIISLIFFMNPYSILMPSQK